MRQSEMTFKHVNNEKLQIKSYLDFPFFLFVCSTIGTIDYTKATSRCLFDQCGGDICPKNNAT